MAITRVPYQFDSATRRDGPQWNYFGWGPGVVATAHGSAPPWTSLLFQNQIGGQPQELEVSLHSLDPTIVPPGQENNATQYWVQLFLVPASVVAASGIPPYEIYNVGIISTETWIAPAHILVNPGYELLALTPAGSNYAITWNLNVHTVV